MGQATEATFNTPQVTQVTGLSYPVNRTEQNR